MIVTMTKVMRMRWLALLLVSLLLGCQTTKAADTGPGGYPPHNLTIPDGMKFFGKDYRLAWKKDLGNLLYLEYLPPGQDLETWTDMITVQVSGMSRAQAMNDFIQRTQPYRVEDVRAYENKTTDEVVLDALLFDSQDDWVEHNLVKFSKHAGLPVVLVYVQTRVRLSEAKKDISVMGPTIRDPRMAKLEALGKVDFYALADIR